MKDANGDEKDDSEQYLLTFDLEAGATYNEGYLAEEAENKKVVFAEGRGSVTYYLNPGDDKYPEAPTAADMTTTDPDQTLDKWLSGETEYSLKDQEVTGAGSDAYKATYGADLIGGGDEGEDPDDIPDKYQRKITYTVVNGTWKENNETEYTETVTLKEGDKVSENGTAKLNPPTPVAAGSEYMAKGWDADPATVTINKDTEKLDYTYTFVKDANGDEKDDSEQYLLTFDLAVDYASFKDDFTSLVENHKVTLGEGTVTYYLNMNDPYPAAPGVTIADGTAMAFDKWLDENDNEYVQKTVETVGISSTYTATYAFDAQGGGDDGKGPDGIPDKYQFFLTPEDTTIYTGGTIEGTESNGFPQPEATEEVTSINVNGEEKYTGGDPDDVLKQYFAVKYYDQKNKTEVHNDMNEGVYTAMGYQLDNSLNITINEKKVAFVGGNLVIRFVSDPEAATRGEIYQKTVTEVTAPVEQATAIIPEGSTILTNNDKDRVVDPNHTIAMMDDALLPVSDTGGDRQPILEAKADALIASKGYDAETIENLVYDFHYLDLVDMDNGNAWVSSTGGSEVYLPYPEGTDQYTELAVIHFPDLHREYGINNEKDIETAVNGCTPVIETVEKTPHGIVMHIGQSGFSPFAIVYDQRDVNGGNDNPGGGGGSHDNDSTTGGSGTVADPYVVRLHGNWVHMDPNDIFKPISEPVPEGATPVTNPEWHQWKFILNNGTMLFNRWAYIRNPYAVGDQPREGWFYFNRDGIMQYGWYRDEATGKWYYAHRESDGMLGTLRYGWHHDDQDGRWYYLDPTTGEMLLGWRQIDGKWYYFNPYAPEVTWNYNEATGGWTYNGSASRPYGSMYQNEMTPDGYQVDGNGAWVQ